MVRLLLGLLVSQLSGYHCVVLDWGSTHPATISPSSEATMTRGEPPSPSPTPYWILSSPARPSSSWWWQSWGTSTLSTGLGWPGPEYTVGESTSGLETCSVPVSLTTDLTRISGWVAPLLHCSTAPDAEIIAILLGLWSARVWRLFIIFMIPSLTRWWCSTTGITSPGTQRGGWHRLMSSYWHTSLPVLQWSLQTSVIK